MKKLLSLILFSVFFIAVTNGNCYTKEQEKQCAEKSFNSINDDFGKYVAVPKITVEYSGILTAIISKQTTCLFLPILKNKQCDAESLNYNYYSSYSLAYCCGNSMPSFI